MRGLLLFLVFVPVAAAGTIEDTIPDARYREYGEAFEPFTARLVCRSGSTTPTGCCVPISPCWALTAAHVLDGAESADVVTVSGTHPTDARIAYHGWRDEYAEHDIAIVHVSRRFVRYAPLTDGTERLGTVVTAAGFGVTGRLSTGYDRGDGQIRAGTQLLSARERSVYLCDIRRGGTPLPFCIAPGDSGGGLWGTAADGRTVLIGINSFTANTGPNRTQSRAGEQSGHTRVADYLPWIREVAGELDGRCTLGTCR